MKHAPAGTEMLESMALWPWSAEWMQECQPASLMPDHQVLCVHLAAMSERLNNNFGAERLRSGQAMWLGL